MRYEKLKHYLKDENICILFKQLRIKSLDDLKNIVYDDEFLENNFDMTLIFYSKSDFFDYLKQDPKTANEFLDFLKENDLNWQSGYRCFLKNHDSLDYRFYNQKQMFYIIDQIDYIFKFCKDENISIDFDKIYSIVDKCFYNSDYDLKEYKNYIESFILYVEMHKDLKHNKTNKIKGVKI